MHNFAGQRAQRVRSACSTVPDVFTWSDGAVNDTLERACKKLGIEPKITCHSFRHTYISNLIRLGVPLPTIEKVSGDNQETILKRYSHMFEQDERLVLAALQNL